MIPLRFGWEEAQAAHASWGFNCGPGAICAALSMTPDELRPHMPGFAAKGYTNPTLMHDVLNRLKVDYRLAYRGDGEKQPLFDSPLALTRIQWGGPWTGAGVPIMARYRHTHWIATTPAMVFDVNCIGVGGWVPRAEWTGQVAPWLIREAVKRGDGTWWPTHVLEIRGRP